MASCTKDLDCPAPLVCFRNVSWNDGESFCGCSNWYGWQNTETEDKCNVVGLTVVLLAVLTIAQLLPAFVAWALSIRDAFGILSVFKGRVQVSASNTTLMSVSLGLFFYVGWKLFYLIQILKPSTYTKLIDGNRESTFGPPTQWLIMFCQVFAFLASLNVSVMWIEISQHTKQMTPKMSNNVKKYRNVCLVTGFLFSLCMLAAVLMGKVEAGPVLAIPFLFLLAVVFLMGRIRMVSLLSEALSRVSDDVPSSTKPSAGKDGANSDSTAVRTRRAMHAIKTCSGRVIVSLFAIAAFGIIYFMALTLPKGGWREFNGGGAFKPIPFIGEAVSLAMLVLLWSIFWYSHSNTRNILRRERLSRISTESVVPQSRDVVTNRDANFAHETFSSV